MTQPCQQCGAALAPGATQCAYCGAITQLAHDLSRQAHAQQQHLAYQQHQVALQHQVARQHDAKASIERTALHSLLWSALGLLCCVIPLFGIVGIVMALRARKMARKYGLVIPATATLGLVLGVFSLLASVFSYTFIVFQEIKRADRIDVLESKVGAGVLAERLAPETACHLAELRLLKDGIGSVSGGSVEEFECTGKLQQDGDSAVLDDYSFDWTSHGRRHVKVCYRRGTRWTATGFRAAKSCNEPDDVAALFRDEPGNAAPAASEAAPSDTATAPSAAATASSAPAP